jgi:hypothetical protein
MTASVVFFFLLAVIGSVTAQPFLQANGANLVYGSQSVILKGTNFDNINCLGANIGTGNPSDISFNGKQLIELLTLIVSYFSSFLDFDYSELARAGGNHARFGLSFNWWQQYKTVFYQKLDQNIALAKKYNLWLILNMFTTPGDCYEGYSNSCGFWSSTTEQDQLQVRLIPKLNFLSQYLSS